MKKFHLLACLCLCAGLLVSCGDKDSSDSTTTTNMEATSKSTPVLNTAPTEKETESDTISEQLQFLVDNKEIWLDTSIPYQYAVTDFNQDGKLEIVRSICEGTGVYTTTQIFEVDASISSLINYERIWEEYHSQADLIVGKASVYYDKENNIYHYVFDDLSKNGAAEYYENKRDWYLQDEKIVENYLAFRTTLYQEAGASVSITCNDANQEKEITEEEYNQIADVVFSDLTKMEVSIPWIVKDVTELQNASASDLSQMLSESWKAFQIQ